MAEKSNPISSDYPEQFEQFCHSENLLTTINNAIAHSEGNVTQFLTVTIPFENLDPLAVLEILGDEAGFRFFWEHPEQEISIAASGKIAIFKSRGLDRMRVLKSKIDAFKKKLHHYSQFQHSLAGPFFLGGAAFSAHSSNGIWNSFGNTSFTVPEWVFAKNGKLSLLSVTMQILQDDTTEGVQNRLESFLQNFHETISTNIRDNETFPETNGVSKKYVNLNSDQDYKNWYHNVETAKSLIKEHTFEKIVLAREKRIQTENKVSATRFLHLLRKEYPSCYTFMHQANDQSIFLGSTPEKLISLEGKFLRTEALAGTISRGKTATQDALLENKLQNSAKDLEEHSYVVEAIREKLRPYTSEIEIGTKPVIRKYSNVQHLYTAISGSVTNEIFPLELVSQLHPTPAVGGFPQESALPFIQQLEQFDRGWYAGPIGWFNTNSRAEFSVALRCGLIQQQKIRFFAGCGIVEDSDPEAEWDETNLKFMPMLNALDHAAD